jgi:hypothetical protein
VGVPADATPELARLTRAIRSRTQQLP